MALPADGIAAPRMTISATTFSVQKAGNSPRENEDAWLMGKGRQGRCSFAIADGATETSFAGLWAHLLVGAYVKEPFALGPASERLEDLQREWDQKVFEKQLKYYAREKALEGAFAAFLGVTFDQAGDDRSWRAIAIGDSCLFQVRAGSVTSSFPIAYWQEFGNSPLLLSSRPEKNTSVWAQEAVREQTGEWDAGDVFLLMTDALACWFLKDAVSAAETVREVIELGSLSASRRAASRRYRRFVERLRSDHALRNDDTTLIIIQMQRTDGVA